MEMETNAREDSGNRPAITTVLIQRNRSTEPAKETGGSFGETVRFTGYAVSLLVILMYMKNASVFRNGGQSC